MLDPQRNGFRLTARRRQALALLAGGRTTHPGSQTICYALERAGLTQWDKAGNRYRLTPAGIAALAHLKTPNGPGEPA